LKLSRPEEARKSANKVLEKEMTNVKAVYRRAQSYISTGDWIEAEQDIKNGLLLEPKSSDFAALYKSLKQQSAAANKKEAAIWANSFKKMAAAKPAAPAGNDTKVENGGTEPMDAANEADA
jgi:FK506-binding protein 4/5